MYARRQGGQELTFDFAAGLIDDNLLMVDRETGSVWSQLAGKAVSGSMRDTPLEALPSIQTTWRFWWSQHPDTRVLSLPGEAGNPYVYRAFSKGRPAQDAPHDITDLGLGLTIGGDSWFFPLIELGRTSSPHRVTIGGEMVSIHHHVDDLTAWAENEAGGLLVSVLAYRDGWLSFSPDSHLFQAPGEDP